MSKELKFVLWVVVAVLVIAAAVSLVFYSHFDMSFRTRQEGSADELQWSLRTGLEGVNCYQVNSDGSFKLDANGNRTMIYASSIFFGPEWKNFENVSAYPSHTYFGIECIPYYWGSSKTIGYVSP